MCRPASATCSRTAPSPSACFPELFARQSIAPVDAYTEELFKLLVSLAPDGVAEPERGGAHAGHLQLGVLRALVPRPADGRRARGGQRPRGVRRRPRVHAHDRRTRTGRRHLPAHRRPVPRSRGVPPRVDARRARADAGVEGRQRRHRQRPRRRRRRRQGGVRLGARRHPLLPRRGAVDRQRADATAACTTTSGRSCSTTSATSCSSRRTRAAATASSSATGPPTPSWRPRSRRSSADPRNWVAQPILQLSTAPTLCEDGVEPRHVDLRPFILTGATSYVTAGGLTRVALPQGLADRELVAGRRQQGHLDRRPRCRLGDILMFRPRFVRSFARSRLGRASWSGCAAPSRWRRPAEPAWAAAPGATAPRTPRRSSVAAGTPALTAFARRLRLAAPARAPTGCSGGELMLLSRVADRIYWAARYVERAEDTARIVRAHGETAADLPMEQPRSWKPLVTVAGSDAQYDARFGDEVSEARGRRRSCCRDRENPGSVGQLRRGRAGEPAHDARDDPPRRLADAQRPLALRQRRGRPRNRPPRARALPRPRDRRQPPPRRRPRDVDDARRGVRDVAARAGARAGRHDDAGARRARRRRAVGGAGQ